MTHDPSVTSQQIGTQSLKPTQNPNMCTFTVKEKTKKYFVLCTNQRDFELVLIRDIASNTFEMSQTFLIRRIHNFLSTDKDKTKGRDTPVGKPFLNHDLDGAPRKHTWLSWRGWNAQLSR